MQIPHLWFLVFHHIDTHSPSFLQISFSRLIINNKTHCYSYRIIGKLTVFLQVQEFNFRNMTVDYSTSDTLCKVVTLCTSLNIDGVTITSKTHTHPSHSQTSRLLTSSLSLGVPVPRTTYTTQCIRGVQISQFQFLVFPRVDFSVLVFSLSSHRHSYIGLVFRSHFLDS